MVSTNAFHATYLLLFSRCHVPTNSVAPFSAYKHTLNPQSLYLLFDEGLTLETSALKLLTVTNLHYQQNTVDNTKLPCHGIFGV